MFQNLFSPKIIEHIVIVYFFHLLAQKTYSFSDAAFSTSVYYFDKSEEKSSNSINVINNPLSLKSRYNTSFDDETSARRYYAFSQSDFQPVLVDEKFSNNPDSVSASSTSSNIASESIKIEAKSRKIRNAALTTDHLPGHTTSKCGKRSLNIFAEAILYTPKIRKYLNLEIPGCEVAQQFYNILVKVLTSLHIPNAVQLAKDAGQAVVCYDSFNLAIFFQSMGNFFIKFLRNEGIEITPDLPQRFKDIMVKSLLSTKVNSIRALFTAFSGGFVAFVEYFGFNFVERVNDVSNGFVAELKALQSVCNC